MNRTLPAVALPALAAVLAIAGCGSSSSSSGVGASWYPLHSNGEKAGS